MGQSRPLFRLFSSLPHHKSITNWKKCGWSTWDSNPGRRIVGADETTELWRPPTALIVMDSITRRCLALEATYAFLHFLLSLRSVLYLKSHDKTLPWRSQAVWPDWAIFETSWQHIRFQMIVDFWAIFQPISLSKNWSRYYLGNFWKHLGNFFPASGHTD